MSKSAENTWSNLYIADSTENVRAKIKRALSDCEPNISYDIEKRPGVSNLVYIYGKLLI